jgi:hypothetical protein
VPQALNRGPVTKINNGNIKIHKRATNAVHNALSSRRGADRPRDRVRVCQGGLHCEVGDGEAFGFGGGTKHGLLVGDAYGDPSSLSSHPQYVPTTQRGKNHKDGFGVSTLLPTIRLGFLS